VISAWTPLTVAPEVLVRLTVAEEAYGIIHHALYQPPGAGSMPNMSDRTSRSPRPAPKNSPTGASTVDRPSKVALMRSPLSAASVACESSTRRRTPVIAPGPVRLASVAVGFGVTVVATVVAPGCAGLGS
jgi:hypothetical protein